MAEKVKGFMLYLDQYSPISTMTKEQKGELLEAFFAWHLGEEYVFTDPMAQMAFGFFKQSFQRDKERYEAKCAKARESISKRWNTNVYERIPTNTDEYEGIRPDTKRYEAILKQEQELKDNINTPLYPPTGGVCVSSAEKPKSKRKPKGADLPPYSPEFEELWKEYPRKDGKGNAWRAYLELSKAGVLPEHEDFKKRIISRRYESDWEKDGGRFVPHMATWLHANGWDDEGCQWQRSQAASNRQDEFEAILDEYSWAPRRDEYQNPAKLHEREQQLTNALKAAGF